MVENGIREQKINRSFILWTTDQKVVAVDSIWKIQIVNTKEGAIK